MEPSVAPTAGAGPSGRAAEFAAEVPADFFTAAAAPFTLASTLATDRAATAVLDSAGGSIEASGADGTRYRLDVPQNALPAKTTIALTPLAGIGGFPGGDPAHALGVDLDPDGLQLWVPATLTITPTTPAPPGVATTSSLKGGVDAGAVLARQDQTSITFDIEHFSEYHAFFPVDEPGWRALARLQQEQAELRLRSVIAALVERERSRQLAFGDSETTLKELARAFLERYKTEVLDPRIRAATFGCRETLDAITAVLEYQRQAQLLAVADEPEFEFPIPEELFVLEVDHCFREQFLRCQAYGDFRGMLTYFLESFTHSSQIQGRPPAESVVQLAHTYLERCGHWRVTVNTSEIYDGETEFRQYEFSRTFDLRWQSPGISTSGFFGLQASNITAMTPLTINKMFIQNKRNGNQPVISNIRTTQAYLELQTINFLLTREIGPDGSVNQGEPIPWELQLYATLGSVRADTDWNDGSGTIPDGVVNDSIFVTQLLFNGETTAVQLDHGWRFGRNPFRATWADSKRSEAGQATVRLEVIVEHNPDSAP